jgi:16S rRNA (guanine527-N7)-methyltransferase
MDIVELWTMASAAGVVLDAGMRKNIERYCGELKYWNEKINLISRQDIDNIFTRHVLHSLSILKYVDIKIKASVLDVGTGGGLPGIPLKIARSDLRMVLLDSIAKKMKTTEMLAAHTSLNNLEVVCRRAEDYCSVKGGSGRKFDVVIARAVAPAVKIVEWTRSALKENGVYALLKGGDLSEEVANLQERFIDARVEVKDLNMPGTNFLEEQKKIMIIKF